MAKRKKHKSPWVLLHEIYLPANRSRSEKGRRDIVTWAKLNHKGKVVQAKKIPEGMVRFITRHGQRHLQINADFSKEIHEIITVRHYEDYIDKAIIMSEHAIVA